MNDDLALQQNNEEFIRKRFAILVKEKETLKAENKALRDELAILKETVKEVYSQRRSAKKRFQSRRQKTVHR